MKVLSIENKKYDYEIVKVKNDYWVYTRINNYKALQKNFSLEQALDYVRYRINYCEVYECE